MKEAIITLETAKLAKEKGFDWIDDYMYSESEWIDVLYHPYKQELVYYMPTQSLLQKWLRDEHYIFVSVERCVIGSDEWDFGYFIDYLPKEHHNEKRRVGHFVEKKSFVDNYPYHYSGAWSTYEEALEEGLKQALNLIK